MAKCAECGFLALRENDSLKLVEVESKIRNSWELPKRPGTKLPLYHSQPVCSAGAFDLAAEAPMALPRNVWKRSKGIGHAKCIPAGCPIFL